MFEDDRGDAKIHLPNVKIHRIQCLVTSDRCPGHGPDLPAGQNRDRLGEVLVGACQGVGIANLSEQVVPRLMQSWA